MKHIRELISKVFRTDQDFDAFVLDNFTDVYRRFSLGMDRLQKENLLLQMIEAEELVPLIVCLKKDTHKT